MIILYDSTESSFNSMGFGSLGDAISCAIREEENGEFELEMEYPISGPLFKELKLRRIIFAKPNPIDDPQPFRIYEVSKDIGGIVTVYARHISADLSGVAISPYSASTVGEAISGITANAATACPFSINTTKQHGEAEFEITTPTTAKAIMFDDIIQSFPYGSWKFNRYTCTYYNNGVDPQDAGATRGANRGVKLYYGKNFESLTQEENNSRIVSAIYPFWGKSSSSNSSIASVLLNGLQSFATGDMSISAIVKNTGLDRETIMNYVSEYMNSEPHTVDLSSLGGKTSSGEATQNAVDTQTGDGSKATFTLGFHFKELQQITVNDKKVASAKYTYNESNNTVTFTEVPANDAVIKFSGTLPTILTLPEKLYSLPGYNAGYTYVVPVDFSSDFSDVPTESVLRAKAHDYWINNKIGEPEISITLDYKDIRRAAEYTNIAAFDRIELCDTITVIFEKMGIETSARVTAITYDPIRDQITEIVLGERKQTIVDTIAKTEKAATEKTPGNEVLQAVHEQIVSVETLYALGNSSEDPPANANWVPNAPAVTVGKYLWRKRLTTYSTGRAESSDFTCIDYGVSELKSTVNTISSVAYAALDDFHEIYFLATTSSFTPVMPTAWIEETSDAPGIWTTAIPAPVKGYTYWKCNQSVDGGGIVTNFGLEKDDYNNMLLKWMATTDATKIDGGSIYAHSVTALEIDTNYLKSVGYVGPEDDSPYSQAGTYYNLSDGSLRSENFAIDENGNVYMKGRIEASSGSIGGLTIDSDGLIAQNTVISDDEIRFGVTPGSYFSVSDYPDGLLKFDVRTSGGGMQQLPIAGIQLQDGPVDPNFVPSYEYGGQLTGYWTLSPTTVLSDHDSETISEWISRVESIASQSHYVLPTATSSTLGGIKVGTNLTIDSATGVLSAVDTTYAAATSSVLGLVKIQNGANTGLSIDAAGSLRIWQPENATGKFLKAGPDGTVEYAVPPDTNTTYALSVGTGTDSNKIVLTPSSGNANKITVPYASIAGNALESNGAYKLVSDVDGTALSVGNGTTPVYFSGGVPTALGYTIAKSVPSDAKFTDTTYSAGTGLSLSGTTFNHSNSVTSVTTAGAYKFKFDSQGHITGTSSLTYSDVGAASAAHTHTYSQVGAASAAHTHPTFSTETNGFVPGPAPDETGFLKANGTWDTPQNTTYSAGTGLSLSGTTFNHSNSVTSVTAAGAYKFKFDSQGHITGTSALTYSDVGAASSGHTHTYSQVGAASAAHTHSTTVVSTATGTATALAFGTKYTITAGGTSAIVQMPSKPTYTYSDVGAASAAHTHSTYGDNLGLEGGKIILMNGETNLSSVTLTYNSVGAASAAHTHSTYGTTISISDHTISLKNGTTTLSSITVPDNNTTYSAGSGLSLSGTTFNHSNSVTSVTTAGLYKVKYDAQGHITGTTAVAKADITGLGIPGSDTNTTYALSVGTGTDSNKIVLTPSSGNDNKITVPYASIAGNALEANGAYKLVSDVDGTALSVGNGTTPAYFSGGVPTALGYTIAKSVPSDAKFTDTTYSAGTGLSLSGTTFNHSNSVTSVTTAGLYKVKYDAQGHITGTTAVAKADITALGIPGSDTNTTYSFQSGTTNGKFQVKASNASAWTDVAVYGLGTAAYTASTAYAPATHSHVWTDISNRPSSLPNTYSLTVKAGSDQVFTYDGSVAKTMTVAASTTSGAFTISDGTTTKTVQLAGKFTDTTYTAATAVTAVSTTSAVGTSSNYARQDHIHNISLATGDSNGQVKIAGTNVNVKGLAQLAYTKNRLFTTNPFADDRGSSALYISKIDNGLYRASDRYDVTVTRGGTAVPASTVALLFDGSYETHMQITNGQTAVITIDTTNKPWQGSYPYGTIYLSFYYVCKPASVSCRIYNTYSSQGAGWHDVTVTKIVDATAAHIYSIPQDYYQPKKIEITIVGDTTNSYGYTALTQIEMFLSRPDPKYTPFVNKYYPETLYSSLTAPEFIEGGTSLASKYAGISHTHACLYGPINQEVTAVGGNRTLTFYPTVVNGAAGLFPATNNANAIITISKHDGNYYSQLGFSSNGNIYYRSFNNAAIDTTTPWKQISMLDEPLAHYQTTATGLSSGYIVITMTPKSGDQDYMIAFTVNAYQGYREQSYRICFYNYYGYSAQPIYSPRVTCLSDSWWLSSIGVSGTKFTFGYVTSTNVTWVAFKADDYTGVDVRDLTKGFYPRPAKDDQFFSVTYSSSLPASDYSVDVYAKPQSNTVYQEETSANSTYPILGAPESNTTVTHTVKSGKFTINPSAGTLAVDGQIHSTGYIWAVGSVYASGTVYEGGTEQSNALRNRYAAKSHTHLNFVGSDGDGAGSSGFVPAPSAGDNNNYLKGDASWAPITASTVGAVPLTTIDGTAGRTSTGWLVFAKRTGLNSNNALLTEILGIDITREYSSPGPECYSLLFQVTYNSGTDAGTNFASFTLLKGTVYHDTSQIIKKIRCSKDNTNHIAFLEIYVDPSFTTYSNATHISLRKIVGGGWTPVTPYTSQTATVTTVTEFDLTSGTKLEKLDVTGTINGSELIVTKTSAQAAGSWFHGVNVYAPNAYVGENNGANGNIIGFQVGKEDSARNCGYLGFHYWGPSSSSNNFLTLGLHSADHIITANGYRRVGINNINPQYTLDVSGTINASSSIKVNGTSVSLEGHTHSYLPLSGGALTGDVTLATGKTIRPAAATNACSLGTSSYKWNNAHINTLTIYENINLPFENGGILTYDPDSGLDIDTTAYATAAHKHGMTSANDMIIGGNGGTPTRLAKGSNNTFLGINSSGNIAWGTPGGTNAGHTHTLKITNASGTTITNLAPYTLYTLTVGNATMQFRTPYDTTCLAEGTKILMADNSEKNIEDVVAGDIIMSYDPNTEKLCEAVIIDNIPTGRSDDFVNYYFDDGSFLSIFGKHCIYSADEGTARGVDYWEPGWKTIAADGKEVMYIGSENVHNAGRKRHFDLHSSNKLYFANGIMNAQSLTLDYPLYKDDGLPEEFITALKADFDSSANLHTHQFDKKTGSILAPILKELKAQKKIMDDNKKRLADSDYLVAKFTEGLISAAEWLKAKAERAGWRSAVNKAEPLYAAAEERYNAFKAKYAPTNTKRERFNAAVARDNACLDVLKAYYKARKNQNETNE